jgi:hypothetical protein
MRRWFQFSLRSLMILVLVVGAYFGGWKSSQYKYEREMREANRKAAKEIEDLRAANALISPTTITTLSGWPYVTSTAIQPTVQLSIQFQTPGYSSNTVSPYIIWNANGAGIPGGEQTVDFNGSGRVTPFTLPGVPGR